MCLAVFLQNIPQGRGNIFPFQEKVQEVEVKSKFLFANFYQYLGYKSKKSANRAKLKGLRLSDSLNLDFNNNKYVHVISSSW